MKNILSPLLSPLVDVDAGHACSPLNPDSHQQPVRPNIGWNRKWNWMAVASTLTVVFGMEIWVEQLLRNLNWSILDLGFDEWWPRRKWPLCSPRFCFRLEGRCWGDAGEVLAKMQGSMLGPLLGPCWPIAGPCWAPSLLRSGLLSSDRLLPSY